MAAVGTALILIPGAGTAVGVSILASLGADLAAQQATTVKTNWNQATVSGAAGLLGGGVGSAVTKKRIAKLPLTEGGESIGRKLVPHIVGGTAGSTTSGLVGEAGDVTHGKGFGWSDMFISVGGGATYGFAGGSFIVADEVAPGILGRHAEHFKHVTSSMGKFAVKGLKTFS